MADQPQGQPSEVQRARDEQERRKRSKESAAAARIAYQHQWVDQQIRIAHARGEFDDLPGAGKPIEGLGDQHDPDWWVKKLIEREQVTGVLPPALQLRKDDAQLDETLDSFTVETDVRREVEDFNARVIRARYTPVDGPPLITMPRDVEETVAAWAERRAARIAAARAENAARLAAEPAQGRRRRWFRRRGATGGGTFQRPAAGPDA